MTERVILCYNKADKTPEIITHNNYLIIDNRDLFLEFRHMAKLRALSFVYRSLGNWYTLRSRNDVWFVTGICLSPSVITSEKHKYARS